MLYHVDVSTGAIEIGTERCSHAVRRAYTAGFQLLHQGIQAAVGYRLARVHPVREQILSSVGWHDGAQAGE